MKCVVPGGSGFIGSFIALKLAEEGHEVIIFDIARPEFRLPENIEYFEGDIRYVEMLEKVVPGSNEVYDCAGVLGTHELISQTTRAIDTNIHGAVNVLDVCRRYNVQRIFHPTKPKFATDWENTYTITKFTAEKFCLMYKETYKMNIAILRWTNATGPRQHLYPIRKAVPLMIALALRDLPLEVYGSGNQTVDIIDVRDVAKIAIRATREYASGILEVGAGIAITVNKLAQDIIDIVGSKSEIHHVPMRMGEKEDTKIVADTKALYEQFPDVNFTPYRQTLEDCVDYYKSLNRAEIDKAIDHFRKRDSLRK